MAKVKTTAIVIAILALLQVSWASAHKHKHDGGRGGTSAVMTVNSFKKGGDGGGPSECDGKYHSDDDLITALSTGWYAYSFPDGPSGTALARARLGTARHGHDRHGSPPCHA
jgi:hypothetical protein